MYLAAEKVVVVRKKVLLQTLLWEFANTNDYKYWQENPKQETSSLIEGLPKIAININ